MKEQQARKNCQAFMNKLQNTNAYQNIKELLMSWKKVQNKQNVPAAIDTFMKISKVVHGFGLEDKDEKLIECFNRCLVKQAIVPKKAITNDFVQDAAYENPQANKIVENVQQWVNKQSRPVEKPLIKPIVAPQQLKDNVLMNRFQSHAKFRQIAKVIQLYLKSIISYDEFKSLLTPLYASDPSLIANLIQSAQQIIQKRRKATVFASLNQLVDKKYPNLERVGQSYILIPQGYANYSKTWKSSPLEDIMNRKCVSVPLGSQVSFIINKKTDYQEQLFNYEDQRYQIDNTLCSLKVIISLLSSCTTSRQLELPLLTRIINEIYPNQNVSSLFINHPELAKNILLPRVIQKRDQLIICRQRFIKICQQIASKNFYKSLDYRCFYFAKNDKKFNCPARWQKQIQMRRTQILQKKDNVQQQQVEDRQSLQRGRYFYINSFDNITKQNFIQNKQTTAEFDRKQNAEYPKYPDNQILFILNFTDEQVLNDVLEVILYYCNRKNLLQLLVFKLMRTDIKKRLKKSSLLNFLIETKEKIVNNNQILQIFANLNNSNFMNSLQQQGYPSLEEVLLNDGKGMSKNFKDSQQQFMQMIQQDQQPVQLQDQQSPFEGPQKGYTLIGTKQIYIFLRFVTAIYQRFLKAKQYSQQFSSTLVISQDNSQQPRPKIDIYKFFLTVIYKLKDRKYFQEYMRKIFCKNAFIFFTLQKMISGVVKVINNIANDSLTFQIIKDRTKDYELGAFDWQKFIFPSVTMQLTRLYLQKQTLFRFTYEPNEKNFYISAWNPPYKDTFTQKQRSQQLTLKIQQYTTKPIKITKQKLKNKKIVQFQQVYNAEQITTQQAGKLILKGQMILLNRQRQKDKDVKQVQQKHLKTQINKIKKMKKKYI